MADTIIIGCLVDMYRRISPPFLVAHLDSALYRDLTDEILKFYAAPTQATLPRVTIAAEPELEGTVVQRTIGNLRLECHYCSSCQLPAMRFIDRMAGDIFVRSIHEAWYAHCGMRAMSTEEETLQFRAEARKFYRGIDDYQ